MSKNIKIIISGGGTGGHIYPAVAVAQALQKQIPEVDILFVGAKGRMEMEKVPKAGYKIIGLWISGLQRSLSLKNLLFPIKVILSIWRSLNIIREFKPDAVIGFGGYASGAMLYAATIKKLPTVIHEQNSYAGITNKILRNRVDSICVAYDKMERFFPERKLIKTGNPIRTDLLHTDPLLEQAYKHFGLDSNKKTLLIIGGSLGAKTINESIYNGISRLTDANLQVIWQTGRSFFERAQVLHKDSVKVFEFIYEMNFAYAAADIVISRAGALSIAELAQVKKPAILVPSPNVAEDHQTKNAMALSERQAALLVKDMDARAKLIDETLALINDPVKQALLKNNIATFTMPNAAERIVNEVMKLIKEI